jgi:hypothetical protein
MVTLPLGTPAVLLKAALGRSDVPLVVEVPLVPWGVYRVLALVALLLRVSVAVQPRNTRLAQNV